VSERRSRLLGLDAPVVTKSEHTGSLGVYPERLAAERELFVQLDVKQLEQLAAESQALVDKAMAMVQANRVPLPGGCLARRWAARAARRPPRRRPTSKSATAIRARSSCGTSSRNRPRKRSPFSGATPHPF
jgi:hypothetical protein